jgi:hypothetical protein
MAMSPREQRERLHEQIASELLSTGVSSVGRWDILRVCRRDRFSGGLLDELREGINNALGDYGTVKTILTTGTDNSHNLVILPTHLIKA